MSDHKATAAEATSSDVANRSTPAWLLPLKWIDANLEKVIILVSYSGMAGIIFVEVIRRFFFSLQAPWSTSIPVLLFLWLTWFGASLNVKQRTHLSLNEIRMRLPYSGQFACQVLDAVLWIAFGALVIHFTLIQVQLAHMNFAIVPGTDNVMQWWFYLATPLAWVLIIYRVLQNLATDVARFRRGEPFNLQPSIMD
ncbi:MULTISPECIES: TRAP transporter small permease [Halomonas]|uniref:TRAP transporter small permease n=1 Tax=Halomonas TaxID=2745 RepID=UPI001C93AE56|nr:MULTISPECIES: TRAP transporter small permease [Halomonas]MBY6208901.1 TRAP transporter small permease [Halomonas sp. DP3Y7-2]MBY6227371.1 TRAP transporter small permease [Halomonas sp. DP3Y7-1]MCA0914879.1 TRAP transporter small permease [Halomonas denitrificans]